MAIIKQNPFLSFKGLSDCRMRDVSCLLPPPSQDEDTLHVQNLTVYFKLCCENTAPCTLCMGIDIEVNINLEKDTLDEDHSGQQEEDYNEEASTPKGITEINEAMGEFSLVIAIE